MWAVVGRPCCPQRWSFDLLAPVLPYRSMQRCCEEQGLCVPTDLKQVPRHKNPLILFANAKTAAKNQAQCSEHHLTSTLHVSDLVSLRSSASPLPGRIPPYGEAGKREPPASVYKVHFYKVHYKRSEGESKQ